MTVAGRETGSEVRAAARHGFTGYTVGRARGFAQANVAILPASDAEEFLYFCAANASACPVLGRSEAGETALPGLGDGIDITVDVPRYEVHVRGQVERVTDLREHWREDLVTVALGCWFGAEEALADAGVRLRHVELGLQGALYRTEIDTRTVGRFAPKLIVSMRPFETGDVARVAEITSLLPRSHGAPVHVGEPSALGIRDLQTPDWGDRLLPHEGETAMFWACGLTATEALRKAQLPFFITHAPGSMLVTDLPAR